MKFQSFIMRVLCFILILGAIFGYNYVQKNENNDARDQQITTLTNRVESLEEQQTELLSALEVAAKEREEAEAKETTEETARASDDAESEGDADSEGETTAETELFYQNGNFTGEGQGYGGTITVSVTLAEDEITAITVDSAPGEDSAYLSQGEGVISSILSAQSTDVDTISGATFSSTGIINAVIDALGKAENP